VVTTGMGVKIGFITYQTRSDQNRSDNCTQDSTRAHHVAVPAQLLHHLCMRGRPHVHHLPEEPCDGGVALRCGETVCDV